MTLEQRFDSLTVADVHQFITNRQEENLHLEFKELSDSQLSSRDDRKNLAKALSGFANSAGGLVIWGIEARKNNGGVDCAVEVKPIHRIARLISRLNELTGDAVSPIVDGVQHRALATDNDKGFAVSLIPESASGPHMAKLGEDRYFKRSGDSFYRMEHYDIADMFGRRPQPELKLEGTIRGLDVRGFTRQASISLSLILSNSGRGSAKAPFLSITLPHGCEFHRHDFNGQLYQHGLSLHPQDLTRGDLTFGSQASIVLHPETQFYITTLSVSPTYEGDLTIPYKLSSENMPLVEAGLTIPNSEIMKRGVT